jgi:hypothetical protein
MTSRGLRRRSALVGWCGALALGACSSQACTVMGCKGLVRVDLASIAGPRPAGPLTARFCVAGDCRTTQVTATGERAVVQADAPTPEGDPKRPTVPVTLRITRGTQVLVDTATTAALTRFAPNGEDCGPVCYSAGLTLRDGKLIPAAG